MAQFDYQKYITPQVYTPQQRTYGYGNAKYVTYKPPQANFKNPLVPENNPYKSIYNYQQRLGAVGQPAPERDAQGEGGLLNGLMRVLQTTGSASSNVINDIAKEIVNPGAQQTSLGSLAKSYGESWTGKRQDTMSDVFDTLGWKKDANPDGKWYNPLTWDASNVARNVLTFAGDVAVDPLTWVSFGGAGVAKNALTGATKEGLSKMALEGTKGIDNIADALAQKLGTSTDDVLSKVSKHDPEIQDTLMRLAYGLNVGTRAVNTNQINYMLDKGMDSLNSDVIQKFIRDSQIVQQDIITPMRGKSTSPMSSAMASRSAVLGKVFGGGVIGNNKATLDVYSALKNSKSIDEFEALVGGIENVMKVYKSDWNKLGFTTAQKEAFQASLVAKFYPNLDKAGAQQAMKAFDDFDLRELDVMDSLFTAFTNIGKSVDVNKLKDTAKTLNAHMYDEVASQAEGVAKFKTITDETYNKVTNSFQPERKLRAEITQLNDGIEFANGLQRVYDASKQRFYFRYHNPFTNTVKPLMELTSVVQNPIMQRAGEAVFNLPVVRDVKDMLGYIFQPEYMGRAGKVIDERNVEMKKVDEALRAGTMTMEQAMARRKEVTDSYNEFMANRSFVAKTITRFQRAETAIPKNVTESAVNIFADEKGLFKEFLQSDKLQSAVTYFRQRNASPYATAFWEAMQGVDPVEAVRKAVPTFTVDKETGEQIARSLDEVEAEIQELTASILKPETQKFINAHKVDANELAMVEKASAQVTKYFESIKQFDETRGTVFSNTAPSVKRMDFEPGDANTEGVITPENYVHAVYRDRYTNTDANIVSSMHRTPTEKMKSSTGVISKVADPKTIPSMADARRFGKDPVDNIIMSMSLRNMESLRVDLNRRLVDDIQRSIATIPGFSDLISTVQRANMQPLPVGNETFYALPEVYNQFNRLVDTFTNNLGIAQLVKYMDNVTNQIKKVQTSWSPTFWMRNFIGEPLMTFMDGVDPKWFAEAQKVINGAKHEGLVRVGDTYFNKGEMAYRVNPGTEIGGKMYLTPDQIKARAKMDKQQFEAFRTSPNVPPKKAGEEDADYLNRLKNIFARQQSAVPMGATGQKTVSYGKKAQHTVAGEPLMESIREDAIRDKGIKTISIGGKTYAYTELMEGFRRVGLGYSGITKGNLIQNASETVKNELRTQIGNKALSAMTNISDEIETVSRLAHFMHKLDAGMGIEEASQAVRLYHVDYRDLTVPERNIFRRLAPYYTYMRKNLPIQVRNMYTNLGRMNLISELTRSAYDGIEEQNDGQMPVVDDYLKEGLAIPLGLDQATGNIQWLNWNLPIADLGRIRLDLGEFFDMNVIEMLHPAIKTAFELPANTSLGFGTPIEKFEGEMATILPNTDTPKVIPKPVDYMFQQLGVLETGRKALGMGYNAITGAEPNPLKPQQVPMLQSLLPIKNQMNTLNNQAYQYRDQLQEYIKFLQQQGVQVPTLEDMENMQAQGLPNTMSYRTLANRAKRGYSGYTP